MAASRSRRTLTWCRRSTGPTSRAPTTRAARRSRSVGGGRPCRVASRAGSRRKSQVASRVARGVASHARGVAAAATRPRSIRRGRSSRRHRRPLRLLPSRTDKPSPLRSPRGAGVRRAALDGARARAMHARDGAIFGHVRPVRLEHVLRGARVCGGTTADGQTYCGCVLDSPPPLKNTAFGPTHHFLREVFS